jgi:hypothetical protein
VITNFGTETPGSVKLYTFFTDDNGDYYEYNAYFPRVALSGKTDVNHHLSDVLVAYRPSGAKAHPPVEYTVTSRDVNVLDAVLLASWLDRFRGYVNTYFVKDALAAYGTVSGWSYTLKSSRNRVLSDKEYEDLYNRLTYFLNPALDAETLSLNDPAGFTDPVYYVNPKLAYALYPFDYNDGSVSTKKNLRTLCYDLQFTFRGVRI